ncbi:hypothetical protein T484DRAFT_1948700 [Baffinella frigidus]|nr:hypothetical protein T484DRAFT_1948700 [Cryptophyta sp. CCMP2293]
MRSSLVLALVALCLGLAQAFTALPALFSGSCARRAATSAVGGLSMAHHVQFKGAKKHRKNRPRKASLADINRAAPPYNPDTMAEVRKLGPAWTAIGQTDMSKYVKLERNGNTFYHVKAPHSAAV